MKTPTLSRLFSGCVLLGLLLCAEAPGQGRSRDHRHQAAGRAGASSLKEDLLGMLGIQVPLGTRPDYDFGKKENHDTYSIVEVTISNDDLEDIPGYVLKPKGVKPPYPVMICLQGHSPGMHISIGRAKTDRDKEMIAGGRDLALQAVENGWAAVVIEQEGFGTRAAKGVSCNDLSLRKLMTGTPMLGHRVRDVSRAIDFIETQRDLDSRTIGCIGNSTGGTVSYFAACADERITLAVVSSSFATYEASWLRYPHCSCGYLPGILEVGDMPDFAALIAPRHLLIVAGKRDHLADIEGVREGFQTVKKIYAAHRKPENAVLIEGDGGHRFFPELAWPEINKRK